VDCGYAGTVPPPLGSDLMSCCTLAEKKWCFVSAETGYGCVHQNFKLMDVRSLYCCNLTVFVYWHISGQYGVLEIVAAIPSAACLAPAWFYCPCHRLLERTCIATCRVKRCGLLMKRSPLGFNLTCRRDWYIPGCFGQLCCGSGPVQWMEGMHRWGQQLVQPFVEGYLFVHLLCCKCKVKHVSSVAVVKANIVCLVISHCISASA